MVPSISRPALTGGMAFAMRKMRNRRDVYGMMAADDVQFVPRLYRKIKRLLLDHVGSQGIMRPQLSIINGPEHRGRIPDIGRAVEILNTARNWGWLQSYAWTGNGQILRVTASQGAISINFTTPADCNVSGVSPANAKVLTATDFLENSPLGRRILLGWLREENRLIPTIRWMETAVVTDVSDYMMTLSEQLWETYEAYQRRPGRIPPEFVARVHSINKACWDYAE